MSEETSDLGFKQTIRLNKPSDVRRLLQRVIHDQQSKKPMIPTERARVINALCNTVLKSLEQGEIVDKMNELEKQMILLQNESKGVRS